MARKAAVSSSASKFSTRTTPARSKAAALSHTGSLAGSDAAYRAAFGRAGVFWWRNFDALLETAAFLAKAPPCRAAGIAVVSTSGGAAIMAADKAEVHGVALPQPGPAAKAVLDARIRVSVPPAIPSTSPRRC